MTERSREDKAAMADPHGAERDEHRVQAEVDQTLADPARRKLLMSTLSHELRSPLLTIRMGSQLVENSLPLEDQHNRELLQHIRIAAQRLEIMAQNLLQMGRLSTGMLQLSCQEQALEPIIEQAVSAAQAEGDAERITVHVAPRLKVWADADRLKQALVNVLSNGLKYSAEGAPVEIRAAPEDQPGRGGGRGVVIEVADHGPGVAPEHHEAIFQPYYRLEDEGLTKPGAGLGLFITRELMRRMGGDLTVQSTPGHGAAFKLSLPGAKP